MGMSNDLILMDHKLKLYCLIILYSLAYNSNRHDDIQQPLIVLLNFMI